MTLTKPQAQPTFWTGLLNLHLLNDDGVAAGHLEVQVHREDLHVRGSYRPLAVMDRRRFHNWVNTGSPHDRYVADDLRWTMTSDGTTALTIAGHPYTVTRRSFDDLRAVLLLPLPSAPAPATGDSSRPSAGAGPDRRHR